MVITDTNGKLSSQAIPTNLITSVSNTDSTLTISPTTGAVVASLNLTHANIWTAVQTIQKNSLGNSSADGIKLVNSTAATFSLMQNSPIFRLTGQGYANTAGSSMDVNFSSYIIPSLGNSSPNAKLYTVFSAANEAVSYRVMSLDQAGAVKFGGSAPSIMIVQTANDSAYWSVGPPNGGTGEVRTSIGSSYFPTFYSNAVEYMRVPTSGNVLIGTTTDNGVDKLQVNGSLTVTNLIKSPNIVLQFGLNAGVSNPGYMNFQSFGNVFGTNDLGLQFKSAVNTGYTVIESAGNNPGIVISTQNSGATGVIKFAIYRTVVGMFSAAGNFLLGTSIDVASAKLTVSSTTQGFLPPVMTTTQKNAIASPAEGLIVYDTVLHNWYGYNGTSWVAFS
jgi:hypothetical protein